jgi:hypothetical protein
MTAKTPNPRKRKYALKRNTDLLSPIIGIDGEGWDVGPDDDENGRDHVYGLLIAADEHGKRWELANSGKRLPTKQCLDFLFKLPSNCLIIAFSFKYDLTKMLEDLPDGLLYQLNHGSRDLGDVTWEPVPGGIPYEMNYLAGKFTVKRGNKERVIWDFFKFYATSFVKALKTWEVGLDVVKEIEGMKAKRGTFKPDELGGISHYCYLECVNLARLGRKLVVALDKAKLDLAGKYYGAGSVGGAVLSRMNAEDENQSTHKAIPDKMREACKRAFFGGRFEIARNGLITTACYERDISSAYPYQIYLLPCLRDTCGQWKHITKRSDLDAYPYALVRYSLLDMPTKNLEWGPFPFRTAKGTIVFPQRSGGGWLWAAEFRAGEKLWDNVKFEEAWVWIKNRDCHHPGPFEGIASLYAERCRIGKDGAGIVIKLGYNASYGKTAQTIGRAQFHNWIWAGMITSGCRAQLLTLAGQHKSMTNIVMMATDGLYSTEQMGYNPLTKKDPSTPQPIETGTGIDRLVNEKGQPEDKPLGGWETTELKDGMFIVRPGIYFKLNDEEGKKVRSRGIGTGEMTEARQKLIDHFLKTGGCEPYVFELKRFCGMKTCIGAKSVARIIPMAEDGLSYRRPYYGRWKTAQHELSFDPMPKRTAGFAIRGLPDPELEGLSAIYSKSTAAEKDEESRGALLNMDHLMEQPDYEDTVL